MKSLKFFAVCVLAGLSIIVNGCKKSDNPVTPETSNSTTNLSIGFSKVSSQSAFGKVATVDSLRIDSVIVVLQRIKFELNIDTVGVDSTGNNPGDDDRDSSLIFRGPFIIHVRDSNAVNFADQVIPAGNYSGIKFKVHRMLNGEKFEDSDDYNRRQSVNNDSIMGYSVGVWGALYKNGAWVPFHFKSNMELEFKIKGNFTIATTTNTLNIALRFSTGDWFRDLNTGFLLDPTDLSQKNQELIREAVKKSFEQGKGGRDSNDDGHPDND